MPAIFDQTYNLLKSRLGDRLEELFIDDVRIGLYLTAVKLSDNSVGTASNLTSNDPVCIKSNRDFGDFTPLKIKGQKVSDIMQLQKQSDIISSLRTAVLNAIASSAVLSGDFKIVEKCDPLQLLDLAPHKTITIVGAFHSYIQTISQTGNTLLVLELNENALRPEEKKYYVPAGDFMKVIPESDIVIITGQTIVNSTIDELVSSVMPDTQVIVAGPSSGLLPDVLFNNKVNIIGTVKITQPDILFELVSQGGAVFHMFEYCAEKICILKTDETPTE
ncbi:MAG: DUF364 domain-containing protein [Bacteroidales bacterium]|jgi:uncharacterized protein (DUF4213/DUF364 family)|nr:DUF364 domain-containing protein [Bacteroidales bacterium]